MERAGGKWTTRYSVRGVPFDAWIPSVPRIADEVLDSVIYLYRSRHEAEEGIEIGGSGFLISYKTVRVPPPANFIYAVTNAHVIEAGACCVRLNTGDGATDVFEFSKSDWCRSETDDLAVLMMPACPPDYRMRSIGREMFLTETDAELFNVGIGDQTVALGRFINHEGRQQNRPMGRFGFIAQVPHEPIEYYIGSRLHAQESYVADIKSIGGYSGSPVLVMCNRLFDNGATVPQKYTNWLLGVDWGHILDWRPVCGIDKKPLQNQMQVQENTGMMGIVPAWKLEALLQDPKLQKEREKEEEKELRRRAAPKATADFVGPLSSDENPKHREDFNSLLRAAVKTPARED